MAGDGWYFYGVRRGCKMRARAAAEFQQAGGRWVDKNKDKNGTGSGAKGKVGEEDKKGEGWGLDSII